MAQPKRLDVRQAALALPPSDRLALATELLSSVEGTDADWEAAWSAELDRRASEADAHPEQGIPWPVVRAEIEATLRQKQ
jgi:putative addiction module component (TIGR02574 family)